MMLMWPSPRTSSSDDSLLVDKEFVLPEICNEKALPQITMMVGTNNRSTHIYYLRSCRRKRLTEIESLPDEVMFDVLVRLEAQDIYDSARLVCSKWYHMIHTHTFIHAHLHHSTYGLLFQTKSTFQDSLFMVVGESGRVEISKSRYKPRCPVPTSCNGLLLELQEESNSNFYVSNPITRQMFALPRFVGYTRNYHVFGIAYAAATMGYKAVRLLYRSKKSLCFILTIRVDKSWRTVGMEFEPPYVVPLNTEGFMHWYDVTNNEVLTMNVETEIITKTSGPIPRVVYRNRGDIYLSTGRYLSMLRPCGEFCWEVWEMKPKIDYRWRKVCDISLEAHKCSTFQGFGSKQYELLIPTGWLKYLEVLLVFGVSYPTRSHVLVFNLLSQEIVTIDIPCASTNYNILVHKNSLVWF
ncbi:hypothetical protein CASFOL_026501 [Castilleja foliolosa]|uniref:F-box domain-containing protein n=1 Tax=Castilleja foliolosa TaxID=1961234 RepID=A0ABD3CIA4_9LAMI